MIFNEQFVKNNQAYNPKLYVTDAGILKEDHRYTIERLDSPTNVMGCVLSGVLHVKIYDKAYQVYALNSFILPHHTKYEVYADPDLPCRMLWVNVRGVLFEGVYDSLFPKDRLTIAGYDMEGKFHQIASLMAKDIDTSGAMMKTVIGVAIDIHRHSLPEDRQRHGGKREDALGSMERYILNRVQFDFSVHDMAAFFDISGHQLNRVFKAKYKTTPYQYYQAVRMDLVKSMLKNTALTIQQISDRMGYSNRNNFSARFKALTGQTPVAYRKATQALAQSEA